MPTGKPIRCQRCKRPITYFLYRKIDSPTGRPRRGKVCSSCALTLDKISEAQAERAQEREERKTAKSIPGGTSVRTADRIKNS
jgi:hypothetical protein